MTYNYGSLTLIQLIFVIFFSSLVLSIVGKRCSFDLKKLLLQRNVLNFVSLILFCSVVVLLIFLSSFREIGDYGTHIGGYDAFGYKAFFLGKLTYTHFEPGYVLLNKIVRLFTGNYAIFLMLVSFFMICCMIKFLKEIDNYNFFLVFLLLCTYFSSFNTLRTIMAIFICLLVITKLSKNNYFAAIILALLATSLHVSSIIIFPVILLNYLFKSSKKISYYKIIFLVILMSVCSFFVAYYSANYLSSTAYESYVNNGKLVINIYLFAALIFALAIKKYEKLLTNNVINKTFIISLPIIFLVFPMQIVMVITYRMIEFFLPLIYTVMAQIYKIESKLMIKGLLICLFMYKIVDFFLNCRYIGIMN